jgi:hypothetical protein
LGVTIFPDKYSIRVFVFYSIPLRTKFSTVLMGSAAHLLNWAPDPGPQTKGRGSSEGDGTPGDVWVHKKIGIVVYSIGTGQKSF